MSTIATETTVGVNISETEIMDFAGSLLWDGINLMGLLLGHSSLLYRFVIS